MTQSFEARIGVGVGFGKAWYRTQKEHWIEWLRKYSTEGPYSRCIRPYAPAKLVYNRLRCPPMLLWLSEALCVREARIIVAAEAAASSSGSIGTMSAVIRCHLPWHVVAYHIMVNHDNSSRLACADSSAVPQKTLNLA